MSSLLTLCFFFKTFIFPLVRDAFDPSETQARSQHITQLRDARYSTPTNAAVRRWLRNIVTNSFHLSVFRAPIRGSSPARPRPMRSRGTRGGSFPSNSPVPPHSGTINPHPRFGNASVYLLFQQPRDEKTNCISLGSTGG